MSRGRKIAIGVVVLVVAIAATVMVIRLKHGAGGPPGGTPTVEVVQVEQKDVPIYGEWIGTLDGFVNADVRAQVTGYLMRAGLPGGCICQEGPTAFSN